MAGARMGWNREVDGETNIRQFLEGLEKPLKILDFILSTIFLYFL